MLKKIKEGFTALMTATNTAMMAVMLAVILSAHALVGDVQSPAKKENNWFQEAMSSWSNASLINGVDYLLLTGGLEPPKPEPQPSPQQQWIAAVVAKQEDDMFVLQENTTWSKGLAPKTEILNWGAYTPLLEFSNTHEIQLFLS